MSSQANPRNSFYPKNITRQVVLQRLFKLSFLLISNVGRDTAYKQTLRCINSDMISVLSKVKAEVSTNHINPNRHHKSRHLLPTMRAYQPGRFIINTLSRRHVQIMELKYRFLKRQWREYLMKRYRSKRCIRLTCFKTQFYYEESRDRRQSH